MSLSERLLYSYLEGDCRSNIYLTCSELLKNQTEATVELKKTYFDNCINKSYNLIGNSLKAKFEKMITSDVNKV